MQQQKRGKDLKPGDTIANLTDRQLGRWYGQVEWIEPHQSFAGWTVAHFSNALSISIAPDELFYVKRAGEAA